MTSLPRPGPTDALNGAGTELDVLWDQMADTVEATEAKADAALPATAAAVGALISSAAGSSTPADSDQLALSAAGVLKRLSWGNLKTSLQGFFAFLAGVAGGQKLIGGTAAADGLTLQGTSAMGTTGTDKALRMLAGDNGVTEGITVLNNGNVGIAHIAPMEPFSAVAGTIRARDGKVAVGKLASFSDAVPESGVTGSVVRPTNITRFTPDTAGTTRNAVNWTQTVYGLSSAAKSTLWSDLHEYIVPASNTYNFTSGYNYGTFRMAKLQGSGTMGYWRQAFFQVDDYISTVSLMGVESFVNKYGSSGLSVALQALNGIAQFYGSGTVATAWGTEGIARTMSGCTGTITNAIGVGSKIANLAAGSTIVNAYGFNAGGPGETWVATGPITNAYGAYIGASTNIGTNNWSMFSESPARGYFAGPICSGIDSAPGQGTFMSTGIILRLGRDASTYSDVSMNSVGELIFSSPLKFKAPGSITPSSNGEMAFELTSNTTLTVHAKGSDSVVRSVTLTLT